jgi:hypothetical protein
MITFRVQSALIIIADIFANFCANTFLQNHNIGPRFQNASGVLVYDNEDSSVLQSMKVEWFKIPSVFTYNWKGKEIIQLIRSDYFSLHLPNRFSSGCHLAGKRLFGINGDDCFFSVFRPKNGCFWARQMFLFLKDVFLGNNVM